MQIRYQRRDKREMFERFTQRARHIIVLAQDEAKRRVHSAVGTEHILLGIIREGGGVACKVLESLSITPERVRAEIESVIGRGEGTPYEEVAFTPRAKKVLELALDEARRLGHNYIGTEHLLLGLIREGEGVAARVLEAMGADLERVRSQIVYILGEERTVPSPQQSSTTPAPGPTVWPTPVGMATPGELYDPTAKRLDEITARLVAMEGHVQMVRTELHSGLRSQFRQFAALVLALGILTVGVVTAALFFRH